MRRRDRETQRPATAGFTLVELLVVITIIGIIIALVLVASADGVRRAEERATQSLITKLNEGLNDRIDALQNITAPINPTHRFLAAVCFKDQLTGFNLPVESNATSGVNSTERRAQVIAQTDYIRAELPDVFFVNNSTSDGATVAADYPLNFAGRAYPTPSVYAATAYDQYLLPLGNSAPGLPYWYKDTAGTVYQLTPNPIPGPPYSPSTPLPAPPYPTSYYNPPHSGIFGASFSAIGGITKNLGYQPKGYDGVDNDGDGKIDEMDEGGVTPAQVNAQLANHTHKTARAEMLYAVLVEGAGPLGSVFNRDEFTAREVQDTDGDGLPEFVDAWGEPLQFFRWPIYFGTVAGSSDSQRGSNGYLSFGEVRELNPLDPNQLLLSPGWWANNTTLNVGIPHNTSGVGAAFTPPAGSKMSPSAFTFMNYFHTLVDPFPDTPGTPTGTAWDRSGQLARRSYFSKVLILSGGPDREVGVGLLGRNYVDATGDSTASTAAFPAGIAMDAAASSLISIENQASQTDPYARTGTYKEIPNGSGSANAANSTTTYLQTNAGLDDISNHNVAAPGTGVR